MLSPHAARSRSTPVYCPFDTGCSASSDALPVRPSGFSANSEGASAGSSGAAPIGFTMSHSLTCVQVTCAGYGVTCSVSSGGTGNTGTDTLRSTVGGERRKCSASASSGCASGAGSVSCGYFFTTAKQ